MIDVAVTISETSTKVRSSSEKRNKKHEGGQERGDMQCSSASLPLSGLIRNGSPIIKMRKLEFWDKKNRLQMVLFEFPKY